MSKANDGAARRAAALDAGNIAQRQAGEKPKTGQDGASPSANREFLFTYRFGGSEWGISIFAADPAEAREKIKAVALARYDGELFAKISASVPGSGLLIRLVCWWKNRH